MLADADGAALLGMADGVGQQPGQRQGCLPVRGAGQRTRPAAHGAGHRQRGQRPAAGDGLGVALACIPADVGGSGGRAAGVDGQWRRRALGRVVDQPEAVAADGVHVRVDHGDGGGRGHHRLHRGAAVTQHVAAGLGGQVVGGNHHAAEGGVGVDHAGLRYGVVGALAFCRHSTRWQNAGLRFNQSATTRRNGGIPP
jgi:hypothetical protein